MTLKASATDVLIGSKRAKITLTGRVGGSDGSPTRVALDASAPDYQKSYQPRQTTTDSSGRFRFVTRAKVNSIYVVSIAPGQPLQGASPPISVRVYPRLEISVSQGGPRSVDLAVEVLGPDLLLFADGPTRPVRGDARRAYFYLLAPHASRLRRIASGPLADHGCGDFCNLGAYALVPPSRLRHARLLVACTRGLPWLGSGLRYPPCGRRTIRWR